MKAEISEDYTSVKITVTKKERAWLKKYVKKNPRQGDDGQIAFSEMMEETRQQWEFEWTSAEDTGDLHSGPMIALLEGTDDEGNEKAYDNRIHYGLWLEESPILYRWVHENYAIVSFVTELIEDGETVFSNNGVEVFRAIRFVADEEMEGGFVVLEAKLGGKRDDQEMVELLVKELWKQALSLTSANTGKMRGNKWYGWSDEMKMFWILAKPYGIKWKKNVDTNFFNEYRRKFHTIDLICKATLEE